MFAVKKCVYFIAIFLTTSLPFHDLLAKEELKKVRSEQQKEESTQKHVPSSLTIKGAKIKVVPSKRASEQQKEENKQENITTENQPQISLDSTHYDAGEVWEGDEVSHNFIVKNTGTAQLNIKKVSPG